MRIKSALIVGAGGIGSHLAEPLARLLAHHPNGTTTMRIVDGDVYEEKNIERQMFPKEDVGSPKSATLARRVIRALGGTGVYVDAEHGYINTTADAAATILRSYKTSPSDGVPLVFLCVDNDATRRIFYDAIRTDMPLAHPMLAVIDMGNSLDTSSAVTSVWKARMPLLLDPVEAYENLKKPGDRTPGGGCAAQAPSTPQLMVANMQAALAGLLVTQALLDDKPWSDVVQGGIRTFTMAATGGEYGPKA